MPVIFGRGCSARAVVEAKENRAKESIASGIVDLRRTKNSFGNPHKQ
jgi:hypothetical protein